jgi:ribosomal protein L11 methyltransferase
LGEPRSWPAIAIAGPIDLVADGSSELLHAALVDFDVSAVDEQPDRWLVYFSNSAERDRALPRLQREFPSLASTALDVEDEDWAARSQASLQAVRIGRLAVAPPWDRPADHDGLTIVIQPSMGFGTGHHATTRLCLGALQRIDLRGLSVLDVGTGSGVLAIAASLLGSSSVAAIDDDADAIGNALENLELNPGARVDFRTADLRRTPLTPSDVVLANLTGALLVLTAPLLRQWVTASGRLILSGFLQHEEPEVLAAYDPLRVRERDQEGEWMCVTLQHQGQFE